MTRIQYVKANEEDVANMSEDMIMGTFCPFVFIDSITIDDCETHVNCDECWKTNCKEA